MAGPNRQPVTPELRQFVLKHDVRIAELSGQPFGQDYREGLLRRTVAVLRPSGPGADWVTPAALHW